MRGSKNLGCFLIAGFILLAISVPAVYGQGGQPPSLTLFNPEIQGLTVTVNGVTMPGTPGTIITRIHWDWGDGTREDQWFAASHTYSYPGTYTITVTSFQSDGLFTTRSVTVTLTAGQLIPTALSISLEPSIAEANRETRVIIRGVLTRRDTGQGLSSKMVLVTPRFSYVQPQTANVITDGRGFFQADFIVNAPAGTYYFTAVFGGDSQFDYSDARAALTVQQPRGQPPSLTLFEPEIRGLTVTINGVTTPGTSGATITRIQWDWGDGYREDRWFAASHTYSRPGTYTITVTAFQSDGLSTTKTITVTLAGGRKVKVHVYAIDDVNRTRVYHIDSVAKIAGAQIRVDYPGGSQVLTTTSTFPGPYVDVDENSTVTVSLVGEPVGWRFAGYWDIYTISWTPGQSRTFNVGTSDVHVSASFTPAGGGEVKFQGTVTKDESFGPVVCYGSYFVKIAVEQILSDPSFLLRDVRNVEVCYKGALNLRAGERVEVYGYYWKHGGPLQAAERVVASGDSYYIKRLGGVQGSLEILDINYQGTPPNSDGNDQRSVTVPPGATLTLFFRYNEGNANNQYIVRVYPEWDKNRYIANSDNDETISEVGQEIGGYRWDREAFSAPTAPGTYKVRFVYNASATPPTWDRYDRLLAEGTVVVEQRAETRIGTELSVSLEPNTAPENKETTVLVKGVLLRRDNRQGIANKPVVLSFRGQQRTVTTDSRGSFQAEFTVNLPAGSYTFTASFAGDSQFEPSTTTATLTVLRLEFLIPTKLTLEINQTSIRADTLEIVRFSGKLTRTDTGQGLAGKTVYITIPGESVPVPVTTDAGGVYGLVYGIKVPAGTYTVEARYQGETVDNTRYEVSSATATLIATTIVQRVEITGLSTDKASYSPREQVIVTVKVKNTGRIAAAGLRINVDIADPSGRSVKTDVFQDGISLAVGEEKPFSKAYWTVPSDAVAGIYTVTAGLHGVPYVEKKTTFAVIIKGAVKILPVPYYSQGSLPWCAEASLSMILAYYGHKAHMEDIAQLLGLSRNGATPFLIILDLAKRTYGLDNEAVADLSKVPEAIDKGYPLFVPLQLGLLFGGHAVVIVGYEKDEKGNLYFYINDPSGAFTQTKLNLKGVFRVKVPYSDVSKYLNRPWWPYAIKGNPSPPEGSIFVNDRGIEISSKWQEKRWELYLDKGIAWKAWDNRIERTLNLNTVSDRFIMITIGIVGNGNESSVGRIEAEIRRNKATIWSKEIMNNVDLSAGNELYHSFTIDITELQLKPGDYELEIDLRTKDGRLVDYVGPFQFSLLSSSPTPPGLLVGKTIEEAIASLVPGDPADVTNPDVYIGDQEILRAHQLWISGSPVPGTDGKVIDDAMMLKLLGLWSSRKPVSQASGASYQSSDGVKLSVENVVLDPNPVKSPGVVTLQAKGTGIVGLKVEVFDLAGMKVFEQETIGDTMTFYPVDNKGHPLANGVYLCVVTVKGCDGYVIRSEIKKLVVLR